MKKQAYRELDEVENSYWWHVGRKNIIKKQLELIPRSNKNSLQILNIGAGTGGTIPMLENFGIVTNVDNSREAIKYLEKTGFKAVYFEGKNLPFKDSTYDVITALDVLEHTSNDLEALQEWLRVLRPGGTLLITVPAYNWLWSDHDEANMHFRRYSRKSLRKVLKNSGVPDVKNVGYMIVFSLPLIIGYRMLNKIRLKSTKTHQPKKTDLVRVPRLVNATFIRLLKIEGTLQKKVNFPFGTSVIAMICKQE